MSWTWNGDFQSYNIEKEGIEIRGVHISAVSIALLNFNLFTTHWFTSNKEMKAYFILHILGYFLGENKDKPDLRLNIYGKFILNTFYDNLRKLN